MEQERDHTTSNVISHNHITVYLSPGGQQPGGQEANSFEFSGRRLVRMLGRKLSDEEGTWTPGLSFEDTGFAEVDLTDQRGNYWRLGGGLEDLTSREAWEIEGWFTVTLPSSTPTRIAHITLPFSLGDGTGQFSIECEATDGFIQVANNVALKGRTVVPLSIELLPNKTYKMHIVADYSG